MPQVTLWHPATLGFKGEGTYRRGELVLHFGVMAPGVFAVMAPLETGNSRVRTGIKVA